MKIVQNIYKSRNENLDSDMFNTYMKKMVNSTFVFEDDVKRKIVHRERKISSPNFKSNGSSNSKL